MESPARTLVLLIDSEGKGTLTENDEIIRDEIPEYEIESFVQGL